MERGVIEMLGCDWVWMEATSPTLEAWVSFRLQARPYSCNWPYRYRLGRRAVLLWPESRMGEVQEL